MNQAFGRKINSDINAFWNQNSWRHILILFLPLVLFGTYYPIDILRSSINLPFFLLSAVLLIYVISSNRNEFTFTKIDFAWLALVGLMFLSSIKAVNPAISLLGSFGWLSMYLYYKAINSIDLKTAAQSIIHQLFILFFLVTFINACFVILMNQGHVFTINGLHKNIFAFYLIAVYPFFLFYKNGYQGMKSFKIAVTILLVLLLLVLSARNALLMLFITLLFYLFTEKSFVINKKSLLIGGAGLMLFLILLFIPNTRQVIFVPVIQEFYEPNEMDRYYMYRNSIWLFLESPLIGVGLENWRYLAYQNGFEDFFASENILAFKNQDIHSVYAKLLAEIGLVGLIIYLFNLFSPVIKNLKKLRNSSSFKKACIANLIVFLVGSAIFQLTIFRPEFFSPVMLIAFFSLAFISNELNSNGSKSGIAKTFMIILSLVCCVYFTHYYLGERNFDKLDSLQNEPAAYFMQFDKIHKPNLKTHYKGKALLPVVAEYATKYDSLQRAKSYFEQAIEHDPYNVDLLNQSAQFHLDHFDDLETAEALALNSLSIHKKYVETKFILAKIEFQKENYQEVISYLSYYDELKERIKSAKVKGADLPKRQRRLQRRRYQKHNEFLVESRKLRNKSQRLLEN